MAVELLVVRKWLMIRGKQGMGSREEERGQRRAIPNSETIYLIPIFEFLDQEILIYPYNTQGLDIYL